MSLHKRLERLEVRAGGKSWSPDARMAQALEDYFAVLEGREIPERSDPELDAYFAQLEAYRQEIERSER